MPLAQRQVLVGAESNGSWRFNTPGNKVPVWFSWRALPALVKMAAWQLMIFIIYQYQTYFLR